MLVMPKPRKFKGKAGKSSTKNPRKSSSKGRAPRSRNVGGGIWRIIAWITRKSLKWSTVGAVWAVIVFSLPAAWYATDLPDVDKAFNATRRPIITVLAADGATLLATTWGDTLFALGGDSVLATTIVARIRAAFDITSVTVRMLFAAPTVSGLAESMIAAEGNGELLEATAEIYVSIESMSEDQLVAALDHQHTP